MSSKKKYKWHEPSLFLDDDEDKIPYDEDERKGYDDDTLFSNAQD